MKIVIAETIARSGIELLARYCEIDNAVGLTRGELLDRLSDAHGLIVRSETIVDAEMLDRAPNLKVVGRAGVGVDNIDLVAATEAGVLVVNAPQANIISAAEHAFALLLSQARNIPSADAALRAGRWDRRSYQGVELHGKVLGIIGLGRIGSLVAARALGFGMKVIGFDPYISGERARRLHVDMMGSLDELLAAADFISIHLPRNKQTLGLIGADRLGKMKDGVRIVNASRGGIVDEDALADAVQSGKVAGAALDVFDQEPLGESPLLALPQVVLTPHLGASTTEAQDKAGSDVAQAVANALRGELVVSAVNVDMGRDVVDEIREFLPLAEFLGRIFVRIAAGLPNDFVVRTEGRISEYPARPLRLAALKGALSVISDAQVSFVNVENLATRHGMAVAEESTETSEEYVSLLRISGAVGERAVSVAGTLGRKGPHLVSIFGHEVELALSRFMLLIRNEDVPGVIGSVGTFLGERGFNIANMAVGQSPETGEAAMMGLSINRAMTDRELDALRSLEGVEEAQLVELPLDSR